MNDFFYENNPKVFEGGAFQLWFGCSTILFFMMEKHKASKYG